MLNKYLPEYHFKEKHSKIIKAPAGIVYPQVRHLNFNSSLITHILFIFRGLNTKNLSFDNLIDKGTFFTLEEEENKEWVIGILTRSFLIPVVLKPGETYKEWNPGKGIKIAWNFLLEDINNGHTKVSTETRILCLSRLYRFWFTIYWLIIRPFSGLIRLEMLRIVKKNSQKEYKRLNRSV